MPTRSFLSLCVALVACGGSQAPLISLPCASDADCGPGDACKSGFCPRGAALSGPPDFKNTTLTVTPATVYASGRHAATIQVTARDASGKPVGGQVVSLTVSGSSNVIRAGSVAGKTNYNGVFYAYLYSTKAELKTVTAAIGSVTHSQTVTFVYWALDKSKSSLTASSDILEADGTSSTALTVTVLDVNSNPAPGRLVNMVVVSPRAAQGYSFTPSTGTTDQNGQFVSAFRGTLTGSLTLGAGVPTAFTLTHAVTLQLVPDPNNSSLSADPSAPADGVSPIHVTVSALDPSGIPVPGAAVSFSADGVNNSWSPASGVTAADGTFTAQVTSTTAQTENVIASLGGFTLSQPVSFTRASVLTASPSTLPADGHSGSILTLQLASSVPVVDYTTGDSADVFDSKAYYGGQTVAYARISSTKVGTRTVTAFINLANARRLPRAGPSPAGLPPGAQPLATTTITFVAPAPTAPALCAASAGGPIKVYDGASLGNIEPPGRFSGLSPQLGPRLESIAYDPLHDEVFVANGNDVVVHRRIDAASTPPLRVLSGASGFLAWDATDQQLVVGQGTQIAFYDRAAAGSAAPLKIISGLAAIRGIAYDATNREIWTSHVNLAGANPDGSLTAHDAAASGAAPPLRTITTNPAFQWLENTGPLAADPANGRIWAGGGYRTSPAVLAFSRTASGVSTPVVFLLQDALTTRAITTSLFFDPAANELWVSGEFWPFVAPETRVFDPDTTQAPSWNYKRGVLEGGPMAVDLAHDELLLGIGATAPDCSTPALDRFEGASALAPQTPHRLKDGTTLATGLAWDAAAGELLVSAGGVDPDVISFALPASGDTAPAWMLAGAAAGLRRGVRAAVDHVGGELFVVDRAAQAVVVFPLGAPGDPAPLRVLSGSATMLADPVDVSVDAVHGLLAVANAGDDSVVLFPRAAQGDTPPLARIGGAATGLSGVASARLEPGAAELYVASAGTGTVDVFPQSASGAAAPARSLQVTDPIAAPLRGLSLDPVAGRVLTFGSGFVRADPFAAQGAPAAAWEAQVGGYSVECTRGCQSVFTRVIFDDVAVCGSLR